MTDREWHELKRLLAQAKAEADRMDEIRRLLGVEPLYVPCPYPVYPEPTYPPPWNPWVTTPGTADPPPPAPTTWCTTHPVMA